MQIWYGGAQPPHSSFTVPPEPAAPAALLVPAAPDVPAPDCPPDPGAPALLAPPEPDVMPEAPGLGLPPALLEEPPELG